VGGPGLSVMLDHALITFPAIKNNPGWTDSVRVGWSVNLNTLSKAVKQIANIADFPEYAITAHILTGMKPILPNYSIITHYHNSEISHERWFPSTQVVIKINTVDLSFNDLQKIYKEYRSRLNFTRKKSVNDKQILVYRMVQAAGGMPEKGITNFWKDMQIKWNGEYPEEIYTTWEGLYKAYLGIKNKLPTQEGDLRTSGISGPHLRMPPNWSS
jgi:hypothetical protein